MHNLRLITGFAFHIVAAVLLFCLIGGAAAALDYYTRLLEQFGISPLIVRATQLVEYFVFLVDLLCFVIYIAREAWLLIRDILRDPPLDAALPPGGLTDLPR